MRTSLLAHRPPGPLQRILAPQDTLLLPKWSLVSSSLLLPSSSSSDSSVLRREWPLLCKPGLGSRH